MSNKAIELLRQGVSEQNHALLYLVLKNEKKLPAQRCWLCTQGKKDLVTISQTILNEQQK